MFCRVVNEIRDHNLGSENPTQLQQSKQHTSQPQHGRKSKTGTWSNRWDVSHSQQLRSFLAEGSRPWWQHAAVN